MKKLLFPLVLIGLMSCHKKKDLTPFRWMSGKWKGETDRSVLYEEWSAVQNDKMYGKSWEMQGNDTVFSEAITLEQRGDDFYYVANVKENGGPVDFKFTGKHRDSIIFENPAHDFPQRVIYFHDADKGMYACIDGLQNGKYLRTEFRFHRHDTVDETSGNK